MNPFTTNLSPSRITLGTVSFGSNISHEEAFMVMDAYQASGGNVLDTAHVYSSWESNGVGASERTVGEWIRSRNARDRIILGTKGGHPDLGAMDRGRCGMDDLRQDFAQSLERLQVERVDIYWLQRAMKMAAQKGCTVNQVALAWLLHQPFPTFPIIGSRSPDHIRESMGALQVQLDPEEYRRVYAAGTRDRRQARSEWR
jgi:aryl-alcohol dehydrogenase-like predicted oxidoreductase